MTIESFDVVLYTSVFLLPGFIIKNIIDSLNPPAKYNDTKYFFSCLLYSIINCATWSWVYRLTILHVNNSTNWYWVLLLIITTIGAIILALTIGIIKQKELIELLFKKIKLKKTNPIPTAWDYFFSQQDSFWVIVTLKSGKMLYGCYSTESFSSSDPNERDLYIERVYTLDKNMNWIEDNTSRGILISKDEIETIEFFQ